MKLGISSGLVFARMFGVVAILTPALNGVAAQGPTLTRVQLAGGSFNTDVQAVSMVLTVSGEPTSYRASESKDFAGASWRSLSNSLSFTLSNTPGAKVVYVQVGKQAPVSGELAPAQKITTVTLSPLATDLVAAPAYVSAVVADTIVLGLPDLWAKVEMPSSIHDNSSFDFWVSVKNAGQITPPGSVIQLYNSFVENSVVLDRFEIPFEVRPVGTGCKITDVPTIECTLGQMASGGTTGIHVFAHSLRAVPIGQLSTAVTLRTRIQGIRESITTNNLADTRLVIMR